MEDEIRAFAKEFESLRSSFCGNNCLASFGEIKKQTLVGFGISKVENLVEKILSENDCNPKTIKRKIDFTQETANCQLSFPSKESARRGLSSSSQETTLEAVRTLLDFGGHLSQEREKNHNFQINETLSQILLTPSIGFGSQRSFLDGLIPNKELITPEMKKSKEAVKIVGKNKKKRIFTNSEKRRRHCESAATHRLRVKEEMYFLRNLIPAAVEKVRRKKHPNAEYFKSLLAFNDRVHRRGNYEIPSLSSLTEFNQDVDLMRNLHVDLEKILELQAERKTVIENTKRENISSKIFRVKQKVERQILKAIIGYSEITSVLSVQEMKDWDRKCVKPASKNVRREL
eukprot:snap_masked-scaffold_4-processed-gene-20.6-mRNA-1 protein AED:1.00 eAED:1.00 QI:0/-1/0/0/-1/1/1/0/343